MGRSVATIAIDPSSGAADAALGRSPPPTYKNLRVAVASAPSG